MKLCEKVVYDIELTMEECEAFRGIKTLLDNLTFEEWDQLCTYIAYSMGNDVENTQSIEETIDLFHEYLETLPI